MTLSWFPVAPEATKLMVVPSTVMLSPAANPWSNELVPAAPDNNVLAVIGAGVASWLSTTVPVMVALTGGGGEPMIKGLVAKSAAFKPPAAVMELGAAVVLALVAGVVGRLAAYVRALVTCAGMKLFWNWSTVGTLPSALPVFGSTATPIR